MATFGAGGTGEAGGGHGADRLPAARAVACARAILDASSKLTAPDGETRAAISVGVHYGLVVIGDVGSARRVELAIIGDTVNVAARLEAMTRRLGVGAAISDEAMAAAGRPNGPRPLGPQPVEGRDEPIAVWAFDRSA